MTIAGPKLMSNAWTGGQYSLLRVIFGVYLVVQFLRAGFLDIGDVAMTANPMIGLIGGVASLALLIGSHDRFAAYVLAGVWTATFLRAPLVEGSSPILVVVLLLLHAFTTPRPYGSWDARGRVDPDSGWRLSPAVYTSAWIILAIGSVQFGLATIALEPTGLPMMLVATALVAALGAWPATRRWTWLGLLLAHASLPLFGEKHDLNSGLMLIQFFTFDPSWVPARLPEQNTRPEADPELARNYTVVFYDGSCGLCHRTIRFLLAEDVAGCRFRYAPLDSEPFRAALLEPGSPPPIGDEIPDSVVVHPPGMAMLTRAAGPLEIGHQLGGIWRLLAIAAGWIPMPISNRIYDFIARVRSRLFARPTESCPLIPAELRTRFLS